MGKRRSSKSSSTLFTESLPSGAGAGRKRKVSQRKDTGQPGGDPALTVPATVLTGILGAIASTLKRPVSGLTPFLASVPQSLRRQEWYWHNPETWRELLKRCTVIRTACTLSETGSTVWFQVILSIPKVLESGKEFALEKTQTTGASNTTELGTSTAAATSRPAHGK